MGQQFGRSQRLVIVREKKEDKLHVIDGGKGGQATAQTKMPFWSFQFIILIPFYSIFNINQKYEEIVVSSQIRLAKMFNKEEQLINCTL